MAMGGQHYGDRLKEDEMHTVGSGLCPVAGLNLQVQLPVKFL
jgi:hypothetical protein